MTVTIDGWDHQEHPLQAYQAAHLAACALGLLPGGGRPVQDLGDGTFLVEVTGDEAAEIAAAGELVRNEGPAEVRLSAPASSAAASAA
jgi:hypothetical protein